MARTWNKCLCEIAEILEDTQLGLEDALFGVDDPVRAQGLVQMYFRQVKEQVAAIELPDSL